jgi:NADH-quinone oxidoreductase subunit C
MSKTNSIAEGAEYLTRQEAAHKKIVEYYGLDRQHSVDKLGEPILWAKGPQDAFDLVSQMMKDETLEINYLSDVTAYDNSDKKDGEKRFVLVYQLYSLKKHNRIRIKCSIDINESAISLTSLFKGANWLEREVYDMFGIKFTAHPNLRRIMMDERFTGHPLRKEYPMKQREPFADNIRLHLGANPLPQKQIKQDQSHE